MKYYMCSFNFILMIFLMFIATLNWKNSMIEVVIVFESLMMMFLSLIVSTELSVIYSIIIMIIAVCEAVVGLVLIIRHIKKKNSSAILSLKLSHYMN